MNGMYGELDDAGKGGADFALVRVNPAVNLGKPSCVLHGAMNKVSTDGIWRCITTSGPRGNNCRAACMEIDRGLNEATQQDAEAQPPPVQQVALEDEGAMGEGPTPQAVSVVDQFRASSPLVRHALRRTRV